MADHWRGVGKDRLLDAYDYNFSPSRFVSTVSRCCFCLIHYHEPPHINSTGKGLMRPSSSIDTLFLEVNRNIGTASVTPNSWFINLFAIPSSLIFPTWSNHRNTFLSTLTVTYSLVSTVLVVYDDGIEIMYQFECGEIWTLALWIL